MHKADFSPTPGYLVWKLANRWRVAVDRAVAPWGLTHAQYIALSTLYGMQAGTTGEAPHPSQRELAEHAGLEPLYTSRLVRALADDLLLERTRDVTDTRTVRLTLTEHGREVVQPAMSAVRALVDNLLAPLGGRDSDEAAVFVRNLTTLIDSPLTASSDTSERP